MLMHINVVTISMHQSKLNSLNITPSIPLMSLAMKVKWELGLILI